MRGRHKENNDGAYFKVNPICMLPKKLSNVGLTSIKNAFRRS